MPTQKKEGPEDCNPQALTASQGPISSAVEAERQTAAGAAPVPDTPPKSNGAAPEPSPQVNGTEVRSLVTFFTDKYAPDKTTKDMAIWELCDLILTTSADTKTDLQLLKLARFGDTLSENNCIRYNDNVLALSGIVGEHDAELMSFDEAIGRLRTAQVTALVYTSPSHTVAKPRWRVVAPTSDSCSPAQHACLVARINGVLGGVLSGESFTLSQPYYYGKINGNAAHRAEYTTGTYINLRFDLDAGAIYKKSKSKISNRKLTDVAGVMPDDPITSLDDDRLKPLSSAVRYMIEHAKPPPDGSEKVRKLKGGNGHCVVVGALVELGLSNAQIKEVYKLGPISNGPRGCSRGFDGYIERTIAIRRSAPNEAAALGTLRSYFAEELERQPVEPVDWIVQNFIPSGAVTGLFGDGGTGKDLLLLMLSTAMTCETTWLGKQIKHGKVMYFPVEDDDRELRRRQEAISNHLDIRYADFSGRLKITPLAGKDTVLAVFDSKSGVVKPTALYFEIKRMVEEFKPALVIVGNRVNIFAVNQNDDAQARQCVQLLSAIALEYNCGVIMPGHVSVAGMTSNSGTSGTVQWSNACRSRLFLSRVIDKDEKAEVDTDARLLEVRKANWGPTNERISIRWMLGVFVEDAGVVWMPGEVHVAVEADKEFLRMLDLTVEKVGLRPTANNYAPKVFSEDLRCRLKNRQGKKQLAQAMDRLVTNGTIATAEYGPPSNRHECIVRVLQAAQKVAQ